MWEQFLIVCPLVFLAGFVDSIAGGGGLISLPAYLVSGVPVHFAIGTNKLSSSMGTALATWRYSRSGYIDWRLGAWFAVTALAGSAGGSGTALLVGDAAFEIIILVALPLTAAYVLFNRNALGENHTAASLSARRTRLTGMAIALVIGFYDGFYGPGTGTFLILLLTGVVHLGLKEANGLAKVINLSTNIAALTIFFIGGKVLLVLGLTAGCFSLLGNYLGTRSFMARGVKVARPLILCVLLLLFAKVLWQWIGS